MKNIIIRIISLLATFCLTVTSYAAITASDPTNAFPAASEPSHPFIVRENLKTPDTSWGVVKKPYPTTAWFGNFALRGGGDKDYGMQPLYPQPYIIKNMNNGLGFGVPVVTFSSNAEGVYAQNYGFVAQMQFTAAEDGNYKRSIADVSDLSASLRYELNNNSYMLFPIVRGSPYLTVFYTNLTPLIIPGSGVLSVNDQPPGTPVTGTRFQVVLAAGGDDKQTWIIYSEKPITIIWKNTATGWQLTTQSAYSGWLRAALLADTRTNTHNDAALFDSYASTIPVSGDVTVVDRDTIAFKWKTANGQPPLMMSLPHQRNVFRSSIPVSDKIAYRTNQGEMQAVAGQSTWYLDFKLPTLNFLELSDQQIAKLPAEQKQAIIEAIKTDSATVGEMSQPDGPYATGKRFSRAARLALLANQFSSVDKSLVETRTNILNELMKNLSLWVKGENSRDQIEKDQSGNDKLVNYKAPLIYDTTWGGIIPSFDDFGSQIYNDHHFHYGYFVYTFAVLSELAKSDNTVALWLKTPITTSAGGSITPSDWIRVLIRDFANPLNNDAYFPFARHIDFFNGHSYASGMDPLADGRNQESVSEAINAYYGIALLGDTQNDKDLAQWGKLLMAQELNAAHLYWQVSKDSTIYAPEYVKNNRVGTIIFDGKVDVHNWFNADKETIYGIQMMPFNGFSSLLFAKPWVNEVYANLTDLKLENTNAWKWIVLKGRLMGAPSDDAVKAIWDEAIQSPAGKYDNGDSKANTLYLISSKLVK